MRSDRQWESQVRRRSRAKSPGTKREAKAYRIQLDLSARELNQCKSLNSHSERYFANGTRFQLPAFFKQAHDLANDTSGGIRLSPARRRAALRIAAVVSVLAGLALVVSILATLEYRYGPIDPTDPGWKVLVVNDTHQPVHVKDAVEDFVIPAGQQELYASPGPGQLNMNLSVTDESGQTPGCLRVELDRSKTVTTFVSSMGPC